MGGIKSYPDLGGRITQCLCAAIVGAVSIYSEPPAQLFAECMGVICSLARQLGYRYMTYNTLIQSAMSEGGFTSEPYEALVQRFNRNVHSGNKKTMEKQSSSLTDGDSGNSSVWIEDEKEEHEVPSAFINDHHRKRQDSIALQQQSPASANNLGNNSFLNQQQLQRSWDVAQRSTAEDWNEWLRRLTTELLKESPSPALRSCAALAQAYPPLARELFHAGFVSCWQELTEPYQEHLIRALQVAFQSSTIPPDILQV